MRKRRIAAAALAAKFRVIDGSDGWGPAPRPRALPWYRELAPADADLVDQVLDELRRRERAFNLYTAAAASSLRPVVTAWVNRRPGAAGGVLQRSRWEAAGAELLQGLRRL